MTSLRWPFAVLTLALVGIVPTGPAHAQFTGPPVTPRSFTGENYPGVGRPISTVENFTGIVAVTVIQGTGQDNKGNTIEFECDVRAMQGIFVGRDGSTYRGTLSFT